MTDRPRLESIKIQLRELREVLTTLHDRVVRLENGMMKIEREANK